MGTVSTIAGRKWSSLSFAALCLLSLAKLGTAHADEPRSTVADLRYGSALYEYYQGNYFEALSELMVAETRGGIRGHGQNPALIKGGISLSFGMQQQAADIFEQLLAVDSEGQFSYPLEARNAAWFYLAKLRYLRGDWPGAEQSLARISGRFDAELLPELEVTAINLAIRHNDLQAAEAQLPKLRNAKDQLHFIYFNLGNAFSRAQDHARAQHYYQQVAALPFSAEPEQREEQLAIYDKAMTAAGYSQLLQGNAEQAIGEFSRVRLDSPYARRALLGYGWAAMQSEAYASALTPWQHLSQQGLLHPEVQEAQLALPYAYEQLGARGQALNAYLDAENAFAAEIARIDALVSDLDQLELLSTLRIAVDNRDWFLLDEGSAAIPHSNYLAELFSENRFQSRVQELRDLLQMRASLKRWEEQIAIYQHMLDQREQNRALQLQNIAQRRLTENLEQLQAKRNGLAQELQRIESQSDYFALASEEERELIEIVADVEANIALLKRAGEDAGEYEQLSRRYKGLLLWQASQAFPDRLWQLRRGIRGLDAAIAEAQSNLARLQEVIAEAPDIAPYRQRIASLSSRLAEQKQAVLSTLGLAENLLRADLTEELFSQRQRLQHYMAEARLSVARLYDQAEEARR